MFEKRMFSYWRILENINANTRVPVILWAHIDRQYEQTDKSDISVGFDFRGSNDLWILIRPSEKYHWIKSLVKVHFASHAGWEVLQENQIGDMFLQ